jgi:C4-dicarboxylate-specific signal transduction histidine kinase
LKQVLLNLVQNSRDASTSDGPAMIDVSVRSQGTHVSVDVMDDGPGIPPEILHRVFDPFFTTKDAVHGVGLGLFVAEGLVRSAGGSIAARNGGGASGTPYRGAWIHIELPEPNDAAAHRVPAPPVSTRAASDART